MIFSVCVCVPLCVAKICAARHVILRVVRDVWAADPSKFSRGHAANASSGAHSGLLNEAGPRAPAAPGPDQDSQRKLNQLKG